MESETVPRHDNWRNYESAVNDATQDLIALSALLEPGVEDFPAELVVPAVAAEYALSDPICALQEAETWHQARSALLFWGQRWPRAAAFVAQAGPYTPHAGPVGRRRASWVARELEHSNQALNFVLSELDARIVAFREIRPQSAGAASRIAYLEHRHG